MTTEAISELLQRQPTTFHSGATRSVAARRLTPVTLELGGKSPVIVDRSANLGCTARKIVWGKFLNAGQTCVAPDYLLVEGTDRAAELVALMRATITEFYGSVPGRLPPTSFPSRGEPRTGSSLRSSMTCAGFLSPTP